jgi:thioredoxin-related protein
VGFFPGSETGFSPCFDVHLFLIFEKALTPPMSTINFKIGNWHDLLVQIQTKSGPMGMKGEKYVFIYVCANWSMPCRKMETETLSNKLVGDFFNANFINIRVYMGNIPEMDTPQKLGEALQITIETYPLIVFLDNKGRRIHHAVGEFSPQDLINEAKAALSFKLNWV